MDIRRIRYFLELCETMNFADAARKLSLSQPALTKAIHKLEEEVGGRLLDRDGKSVSLNEFGHVMCAAFKEVDAAAERAEIAAGQMLGGESADIRIAIMCTIGPNRISKFLANFERKHSSIQIVLQRAEREELAELLLSGNVDCAFVGSTLIDQHRLKYISLYKENIVVAHPEEHRFSAMAEISFTDLCQEPYLDCSGCDFSETLMEDIQAKDLSSRCVVRSDSEEWVQVLIAAGMGVSLVPAASITIAGLASTPFADTALSRAVSLALPTGREDHPVIQTFVDSARSYPW